MLVTDTAGSADLHGCLGVLAGGVPLLLRQLQQLLDALLQVAVRLCHARQLLELPHLGDPVPQRLLSSDLSNCQMRACQE